MSTKEPKGSRGAKGVQGKQKKPPSSKKANANEAGSTRAFGHDKKKRNRKSPEGKKAVAAASASEVDAALSEAAGGAAEACAAKAFATGGSAAAAAGAGTGAGGAASGTLPSSPPPAGRANAPEVAKLAPVDADRETLVNAFAGGERLDPTMFDISKLTEGICKFVEFSNTVALFCCYFAPFR